jgi:hypothetical protein
MDPGIGVMTRIGNRKRFLAITHRMENLISLERRLAHGITKALGVAASICGRVLAKPSPKTPPLFQGLLQLLTFKKYNLI